MNCEARRIRKVDREGTGLRKDDSMCLAFKQELHVVHRGKRMPQALHVGHVMGCGHRRKHLDAQAGLPTRASLRSGTSRQLAGTNVEVLVELIGKHSKVGQVTDLLSQSGFGAVLAPFTDKDVCAAEDAEAQEIRSQLENLRQAISDLNLKAESIQASDGLWQVRLTSPTDIEVSSAQVEAWLLSQAPETAVNAAPLMEAQALLLPPVESADITGLVALSRSLSGQRLMFVLNLPLTAPEDREAAIMRRFIRNREGFVRYVKLLLGGLDQEFPAEPSTGHGKGFEWKKGLDYSAALLEDLVRVWSREPKRLVPRRDPFAATQARAGALPSSLRSAAAGRASHAPR